MPMSHWFGVMEKLGEAKYADQLALLLEHGFSRTRANAVVTHHRGVGRRTHDGLRRQVGRLRDRQEDLRGAPRLEGRRGAAESHRALSLERDHPSRREHEPMCSSDGVTGMKRI